MNSHCLVEHFMLTHVRRHGCYLSQLEGLNQRENFPQNCNFCRRTEWFQNKVRQKHVNRTAAGVGVAVVAVVAAVVGVAVAVVHYQAGHKVMSCKTEFYTFEQNDYSAVCLAHSFQEDCLSPHQVYLHRHAQWAMRFLRGGEIKVPLALVQVLQLGVVGREHNQQ